MRKQNILDNLSEFLRKNSTSSGHAIVRGSFLAALVSTTWDAAYEEGVKHASNKAIAARMSLRQDEGEA